MNEIRTKAKKDYLEGMSYKDISKKHGISINTLKSWVGRHGWAKEKNGCTQKAEGAYSKEGASKEKVKIQEASYKEDIRKLEKSDLTDKQKMFCIYYIKCFNATKAYQKAYEVDYITANVAGPRLLGNVSIKAEIQGLKQNKLNRAMLHEDDIFQAMIDIAFSDITDYVSFGKMDITLIDPETKALRVDDQGNEITEFISYVSLKDDSEVDGTIISEISKGRDGVKVKLQDKMKALEWLGDRMDLLPVSVNKKLELEREKLEYTKSADDDNLDALNKLDDILKGLGGVMNDD